MDFLNVSWFWPSLIMTYFTTCFSLWKQLKTKLIRLMSFNDRNVYQLSDYSLAFMALWNVYYNHMLSFKHTLYSWCRYDPRGQLTDTRSLTCFVNFFIRKKKKEKKKEIDTMKYPHTTIISLYFFFIFLTIFLTYSAILRNPVSIRTYRNDTTHTRK